MLKTVNAVRYLNKNNNANERENYSKWWKEQIEHYGTSTTYFTHGYTLTSHNFLYGEDTTSKFSRREEVIMLTDITNDALMLSKFGIMADCDMTAVIHISSFYEKFGCGTEPKAGDLIQLTEYGADRPGGRSAPIYEITERDDEYLPMTNSLMGHYVWYIKCKRFEYSYEGGVYVGPNDKQVSDGGSYGRLEGGENTPEIYQPYPDSVQNSAKCIYDYYSETPSELAVEPTYYLTPRPPECPEEFKVTEFNKVPGPYGINYPFSEEGMRFVSALRFLEENKENVVLRTTLSSEPGNVETFMLTTSGKSEDTIVYQSNNDTVVLDNIAGSGIISDTGEAVDAGTF
jgi:hypothetical protein